MNYHSIALTLDPLNPYRCMTEMLLKIYLQPKASKNEIVGPYRDGIKVRVTAAPVEGRANEALLQFLAKEFGVTPSSVEIVRGHRSRQKIIRITASLDQELKRRLGFSLT